MTTTYDTARGAAFVLDGAEKAGLPAPDGMLLSTTATIYLTGPGDALAWLAWTGADPDAITVSPGGYRSVDTVKFDVSIRLAWHAVEQVAS